MIYDRERTTAGEILMSVFTEDDILRGEYVSEMARNRVIVSKIDLISP